MVSDNGTLEHRTSSSSLREVQRAEHVVAAKVDAFDPAERLELIKQLLDAEEVDIKALGRLAVAGIPADQKVRAITWQLLLGYLPPRRSEWQSTLQQRHAEYESFCKDFMINPQRAEQSKDDDPLSQAEDSAWAAYFRDVEEYDQIHRDLERTHQTVPFFNTDLPASLPHHTSLQRLLFVFSKLNSGLKYVQGMNELVAPLYMVFFTDAQNEQAAKGAEADTFFCFIRVLTVSETRDLYCKTLDTATTGVASVMAEFVQRLTTADPSVGAHLVAQKVDPHYFAFRWMTVLFAQDIEDLPDVLRVWDFLFGDPQGCKEAVMRFCCALLLRQRTQLLATEFPEIIKVLQSCGRGGFDAEDAIQIATSLSSMYIPM